MQRTFIQTALLSAVISAVFVTPLAAAPKGSGKPPTVPVTGNQVRGYDASTLFIRYHPGTPASEQAAARAQVKGAAIRDSSLVPGLEHMALAPGMTVERAIHVLSKLPFVEYAHPNYRLHLDQVPPDDEYFLEQWGLNNTGQASVYGAFLNGTPDAEHNAGQHTGFGRGQRHPPDGLPAGRTYGPGAFTICARDCIQRIFGY